MTDYEKAKMVILKRLDDEYEKHIKSCESCKRYVDELIRHEIEGAS